MADFGIDIAYRFGIFGRFCRKLRLAGKNIVSCGGKNPALFRKRRKLGFFFRKLFLLFGYVIFTFTAEFRKLFNFVNKAFNAFFVVLNFVFANGLILLHFADGFFILRNGTSSAFNGKVYSANFFGNGAHSLFGLVIVFIKCVIFGLIDGNGAVLFRKLRFKIMQAAHPKRNFKGFLFVRKLNEFFRFFRLLQKRADAFFKSGKNITKAQKVVVRFNKAALGFLFAIAEL